jgi:hypothetical protein
MGEKEEKRGKARKSEEKRGKEMKSEGGKARKIKHEKSGREKEEKVERSICDAPLDIACITVHTTKWFS